MIDTDTDTTIDLQLLLRHPKSTDGHQVNSLIERCKPLDTNSTYCNLLQCLHFADTCMLAEDEEDGSLLGFISAYRKPAEPSTLFVWQVAIDKRARGEGLARTLLNTLLDADACAGVTHLETTITADNAPSWGLFESLARSQGTGQGERHLLFDQQRHFNGDSSSEILYRIALG
ncbi:L-2,4-diaminobutyric acid acetyltransferase [Oceanisphaera marina]|uniref:L-2,4-diaminobutyric acid acetyltransferase n=1 Tax=Oceanisphaera marina TaxID=2017550 RepID=A0ABQ1ILS3_9GAMM|nr:diaminobutyrate acetyltransferase [Oceanisphaera marina]GGB46420.1 L-2,4-diaminobutyric acid acetyltransferase [Oceanisphaera marina]